ncbi:hypothetical protein D043_4098A, partial [Vibrio parahaemolyticus EKP-021]
MLTIRIRAADNSQQQFVTRFTCH